MRVTLLTSAVCCAVLSSSGTASAQLVLRDLDLRPRASALATVTLPYEVPANGAPVMLSPAAATGVAADYSSNANPAANTASHTGAEAPLSSTSTSTGTAAAAAATAAKHNALTPSSSSHSIPSGAIAGIVVGAALLFTSIAFLAFCLGRRHRKSARRNTYDANGKYNRSSSFGSSSSTSRKWYAPWKRTSNLKSRISHPSSQRTRSLQGGELWGGSAVAEMSAARGDGHYVGPMSELQGTFEAVELPAGIVRGDERIRSGGSYGRHELKGEKGSYDRSELRAVRRSDGSVEAVEMPKGWRAING